MKDIALNFLFNLALLGDLRLFAEHAFELFENAV
jgi:hypothetical protein